LRSARTTRPAQRPPPAHRRGIAASPVLTDEFDVGLLRHMSAHQRQAVAEFASQMQTSKTSIRQRVSGGLSALRAYRAAQELARRDRAYRYGGGHGAVLSSIGPREPWTALHRPA
jgi:hypothetical protein